MSEDRKFLSVADVSVSQQARVHRYEWLALEEPFQECMAHFRKQVALFRRRTFVFLGLFGVMFTAVVALSVTVTDWWPLVVIATLVLLVMPFTLLRHREWKLLLASLRAEPNRMKREAEEHARAFFRELLGGDERASVQVFLRSYGYPDASLLNVHVQLLARSLDTANIVALSDADSGIWEIDTWLMPSPAAKTASTLRELMQLIRATLQEAESTERTQVTESEGEAAHSDALAAAFAGISASIATRLGHEPTPDLEPAG